MPCMAPVLAFVICAVLQFIRRAIAPKMTPKEEGKCWYSIYSITESVMFLSCRLHAFRVMWALFAKRVNHELATNRVFSVPLLIYLNQKWFSNNILATTGCWCKNTMGLKSVFALKRCLVETLYTRSNFSKETKPPELHKTLLKHVNSSRLIGVVCSLLAFL